MNILPIAEENGVYRDRETSLGDCFCGCGKPTVRYTDDDYICWPQTSRLRCLSPGSTLAIIGASDLGKFALQAAHIHFHPREFVFLLLDTSVTVWPVYLEMVDVDILALSWACHDDIPGWDSFTDHFNAFMEIKSNRNDPYQLLQLTTSLVGLKQSAANLEFMAQYYREDQGYRPNPTDPRLATLALATFNTPSLRLKDALTDLGTDIIEAATTLQNYDPRTLSLGLCATYPVTRALFHLALTDPPQARRFITDITIARESQSVDSIKYIYYVIGEHMAQRIKELEDFDDDFSLDNFSLDDLLS